MGAKDWEDGMWRCCFLGAECPSGKMDKEADNGDSCTIRRMYLLPLDHTLKNGYSGKV